LIYPLIIMHIFNDFSINYCDDSQNEVMSGDKSPGTVQARALLCFWGHRKLGLTTIELSEKIGVCQSAVSRLSRKGEKLAYETNFDFI